MKNFFTALLCFAATSLCAQNWTGNVSSDWNNSANWTGWPLTGDDITIDTINLTGVKAMPVIGTNSVFVPGAVFVQNGAMLTIAANLSTSDNFEVLGEGTHVVINNGMISIAPGNDGRFIVAEEATAVMNAGTLNADQRLLVELGAQFTMNGGQINVGETLGLSDGAVSGGSRFTMNGGTIIAGEELGFENEFGNYVPVFEMNAGTLTVNGDISWFGELPGSGKAKLILNGGVTTVSGSITNLPLSTIDLYLLMNNSSSLIINGAGITTDRATDSIMQWDNSVITLNATHTIDNAGSFISSSIVNINGNGTLQGTGTYQFHHLNVAASRTLTHSSPVQIEISGNLTLNGTFVPGANTVRLNGTMLQQLSSAGSSFNNLVIVNSGAGIDLNGTATITGSLDLYSGIVNTSGATLRIADNATANWFSDASYVDGPLTKVGNDAFEFPVGKDGDERRIGIAAPLNVASEFTAEYFNTAFADTVTIIPPLEDVSSMEYWTLQQSVTSDPYSAQLYWENADSSGIDSCVNLSIAQWNGSAWQNIPATVSGTCSGSGSGSAMMTTAVSSSGPLTFGRSGITTSIASAKKDVMRVYPNPVAANEELYISGLENISRITMTDMAGRIVLDLRPNSGSTSLPLNFAPGIYYLHLSGESVTATEKLIIQ